MLATKEKIQLEFIINSSPGVLFNRLSTPSGLSEWFADDVDLAQNVFTFKWHTDQQQAVEVLRKDNKIIRFRWLDEEDEELYFEFSIVTEVISGINALVITDFCDPEDKDDTIELWTKQVDILKRGLGI